MKAAAAKIHVRDHNIALLYLAHKILVNILHTVGSKLPVVGQIYLDALRNGLLEIFVEAGMVVSAPTCGPCLGGPLSPLPRQWFLCFREDAGKRPSGAVRTNLCQ